ncbi:MAG: MFS transporter [Candidatus Neomarinimicrobiota bacterium]
MKTEHQQLYTPTLFLALAYNFIVGLIFTNNAIYPLFIEHQGGSATQIGLFMSTYAIAAVFGRPAVGLLIDRFGVRPVLLLGSLLMGLPALGYLTLLHDGLSPLVWLLRVLQGLGFGAHFSAFLTLAGRMAPSGRRNEAVAMYGITGLAANLVGPLLGEQIVQFWGLPVFFIFIAICGLLAAGIATRFGSDDETATDSGGWRSVLLTIRAPALRFPLILALLLAISFTTASGFLAPLASLRNINGFGLYFSGYAVAGIIIRLTGRRWADRFGWRRILIPMFILYGAGLLTVYHSSDLGGLILAGLLVGSAHGLAFPAVTALGYNMAPEKGKGTAMALVTGMMDLGTFAAGIILGQVAQYYGFAAVFLVATLAPLCAVVLLVVHVIRQPQHLSRHMN